MFTRLQGEVLVFRKGHLPKRRGSDPEDAAGGEKFTDNNSVGSDRTVAAIQRQTKIFHWNDVCYDIKIKKEDRRLLDHVDGWVKPGTLTALMGVSGAGKTTLLDVLATRTTMGVITGEMLVNGHPRDRCKSSHRLSAIYWSDIFLSLPAQDRLRPAAGSPPRDVHRPRGPHL